MIFVDLYPFKIVAATVAATFDQAPDQENHNNN